MISPAVPVEDFASIGTALAVLEFGLLALQEAGTGLELGWCFLFAMVLSLIWEQK